ncbi:MAG: type IV pilus secretin PilQ [Deltaproteobacteria bacterium]|nr:type IV pilus secretin PilQ [Deltaproteobacteria bacterium]
MSSILTSPWLKSLLPLLGFVMLLFSPLGAEKACGDNELAPPEPQAIRSEPCPAPLHLPQVRTSMRFVDAEVKDVLRLLAKEYGLNLIISEKVAGAITLDFNQVLLEDIFFSVLKTAGLGYTLKGDVILIATKKEIRDEETQRVQELEKQGEANKKIQEAQQKIIPFVSKMIRVKYILNAKATESIAKEIDVEKKEIRNLTQLAEALRKMLSQREGAGIEVVDAANAIVVTDIPEKVDQIVNLIKELDVPSPQILIEAKITLVDSDFTRELGIQWGGRAGSGDLTITGQRARTWTQTSQTATENGTTTDTSDLSTSDTGSTFAVDLPAAVKSGSGGAIGILAGNIQKDFLDVQLSALEDKGQAKVLASPRVITQDNQKAYIKIGDEIPFVERTVASGVITTELKFKDAAIELEVSPHTVGDEVFMDIVVARKTADFSRAIEGNPPLRAQALTTKVSVKTGETFAVGGLTLNEETTAVNAVPFFSRIPLLGLLFKKETKIKNKRELIIFITPSIVGGETPGETNV